MRKLLFFVILLLVKSITYSQQIVESTNTTISPQAAKELANNSFNYEFVEFPIDKLTKAITQKKNTVKIKLGKQIDDVWTIEENELRYDYLSIKKWDEAGNRLPNKPVCETYSAKSKNQNINIRFAINSNNEFSGFVHDIKTDIMIRFKSISLITDFKDKNLEKNKIAIYSEQFPTNPTQQALTAKMSNLSLCNLKWIVIALETDDEFTNTKQGVLPNIEFEVDYIFNMNLGMRVYFRQYLWYQGYPGYPYNNINTITFTYYQGGTSISANRTSENAMFNAFINNGWAKNQPCNMAHLITGRKLRNNLAGNSGGYSNFSPTICGGTLPMSMSSTEFQSVEQIARTMAHELGHNLAGDTKHENDSPYSGTCSIVYNATNLTPNTLMCPFIKTGDDSGEGGRTMYFSTAYLNSINSKLSSNGSCIVPAVSPVWGQAYYNGVAINSTPFFVNTRNGTITINISNSTPFSDPSFAATVNPTSVYIGPRYINGVHPNWVGSFSINAPSSVSNATFTLQSSNDCGSAPTKTIPVVFSGSYKLYPNPTQNVLTVDFTVDKESANIQDFLPESVVLLTDKSKELKRNEPKKNYLNKVVIDANKFEWDLSGLDNGTYFVHINYGSGMIFKEKILVQK